MMAESNFETKLQTLKNLKNACATMTAYDPVQDLIKISEMEQRIEDIETVNGQIIPLETKLSDEQGDRQIKVHGQVEDDDFEGLIRRSRQVAAYVDGQGKPYEQEAILIRRLVNKMAPKGTRRKPEDEDDRTRSTSEQSFVSITGFGVEILSIIDGMVGETGPSDYNPSDPLIKYAAYSALIEEIKAHTTAIALVNKNLKPLEGQRRILYNRSSDGIRKIVSEAKKYVRGSYGKNSDEWNSVRLIKV